MAYFLACHESLCEESLDQIHQNINSSPLVEGPGAPIVTLRLNYLRSNLYENITESNPLQAYTENSNTSERYPQDIDSDPIGPNDSFLAGNDEESAIIVPQTESQREFLQSLFKGLSDNPDESATFVGHSIRSIPKSVISMSTKTMMSRIESLAIANWNFVGNCPSIPTPEKEDSLDALLKTVPDIVMRNLVSQTAKRVDSSKEAANLTLTIIKPFLPQGTDTLSDRQKVLTYGTAIIGGAVAGTAYLVNNEVNFENEFSVPVRDSAAIASIGLAVEGENIGFSSDNPYVGLGTTFNFNNDFSISLAGGASRVTSQRLSGKQNAGFNLSLPISSESFDHKISFGGSVSRIYKGPVDGQRITGGAYNGNVTYTTSPVFLRTILPNLRTSIAITPLRAAGSILKDPATGVPKNYRVSSEARANISYRVINSDVWTGGFNFSIGGGALYSPRGEVSPLVEGTLGVTIIPKRRD